MDNVHEKIIEEVRRIYQSLEIRLESTGFSCKACGRCCDFDSFGHRLYITTPELIYFKIKLTENKVPFLPMTAGACPYRKGGKCSVYPWRFAGCRIFNCTGNADLQSSLSEGTIASCKSLCIQSGLEYGYMDLKSTLQKIQDMEVL
jgi:Fe-S-cluster containining protein